LIDIRPFTPADLPHGLRLSRQAGWNQTEADWRRVVELQPDGAFVAIAEGRPVATLACALYGEVAWIAMMLVEEAFRGRGIGRALMTRALAFVEASGVPTARLDATPLGQPLYESLGFVPEYTLARHGGRPSESATPSPGPPLDHASPAGLHAFDRHTAGYDRGRLLDRLMAEFPEAVRVARTDDEVRGYALSRPGFHASQVGPCLADNDSGADLLHDALSRHAGRPVFVDIPTDHDAALAVAASRGLAIQRDLLRMYRGAPIAEHHAGIWAIAGPELG
jgi:GNAT superfamily N-acetyltransferase